MKKNKRYLSSAFALLFTGLAFVSCNDNDPDFVYNEKPAISPEFSAYTVNEGDAVTLVLKTSKVSNVPMEVKLEVLGNSTATIDDDFTLPGVAVGAEDGLGTDGFLVTSRLTHLPIQLQFQLSLMMSMSKMNYLL